MISEYESSTFCGRTAPYGGGSSIVPHQKATMMQLDHMLRRVDEVDGAFSRTAGAGLNTGARPPFAHGRTPAWQMQSGHPSEFSNVNGNMLAFQHQASHSLHGSGLQSEAWPTTNMLYTQSSLASQSSIDSSCGSENSATSTWSCGSAGDASSKHGCSVAYSAPLHAVHVKHGSSRSVHLPTAWQPQQGCSEPVDAMQLLTEEIHQLQMLRQRNAAARAAAVPGSAAADACAATASNLQRALQHALVLRANLQQSAMESYAVHLQQCKMKIAAAANLRAQLPGNPAVQRHMQRVIAHQQKKLSLQQQMLLQQMAPAM